MSSLWLDRVGALVGVLTRGKRARRKLALGRHPRLRSILVLHDVRGLGNLILLTGLLVNLRRAYPSARICLALPTTPLAQEVFSPALVDELLFYAPNRSDWFGFAWRILRPRRFDLALATFFSPTLTAAGILLLSRCSRRIGYGRSTSHEFLWTEMLMDEGGHELDRHLRLLAPLRVETRRELSSGLSPAAREYGSRYCAERRLGGSRPIVGIHPGCDRANALKRWPLDRFVAVVAGLGVGQNVDPIFFLGPDEEDLGRELERELMRRGLRDVSIVQSRRLQEVAGIVACCNAFLSNDSGLMHLAASLGVPVVSIFGPTGTEKNAPVGPAVVLEASDVPCRPCYVAPPIRCHQASRMCLEGISEEQVRAAVLRVLSESGWAGEDARREVGVLARGGARS